MENFTFHIKSYWGAPNISKSFLLLVAFLSSMFVATTSFAQNIITVPFNNGFVGNSGGSNSATSCYYFSGTGGLGWTNVQFMQNSPSNIFVAQGNDIIGSVLITDALGAEHTIPGFVKWRAPSGNSPSTMCFQPNVGSSFTLATNGLNGAATYTITDGYYIGLTFNGQTLTISSVPGTVNGNAATSGLLDLLNSYLATFADMSVADVSVNESAGTVTITVTISTTVSSIVTVNYATSNGTAIAGSDYTASAGSLSFPIGSVSQTFTIPILNDLITESAETFTVTLTDPVNISLLDPVGVVTVIDNDTAVEICNGIDDDSDGLIDEGLTFTNYYADVDGDGFGAGTATNACAQPAGYVTTNTDCNNSNVAVYPGATEICNSIDDDCDTQIDEGVQNNYYADTDSDGYGAGTATAACTAPAGYVATNTDCNSTNAAVYPGATEICNSIDDDCDTQIDEGVQNNYYADTDSDGYGAGTATAACTAPAGYVATNTDCNSTNAAVYPGATEICNSIDDDCDTQIDEGVQNNYYADTDSDGYGAGTATAACTAPAGYVTTNTDCNSTNAAVYPGATEICNSIDDDCDTQIDEGVQNNYYADTDGDGYGAGTATAACTAPAGYVTTNTDCNSTNAAVYPGATEICNSIDDDCDTQIDEGLTFTNYYADTDADGYGAGTATNACAQPVGFVTSNTDCNNSNSAVNPGATEICGNGIDENCNGSDLACAVPGCTDVTACNYNASATVSNGSCTYASTWYLDADSDGYYVSTSLSCTSPGANYNAVGGVNGDCNDNSASVNAGVTEICNSIDDDCDTQIDEGLAFTNYYADVDGDGFGAGTVTSACAQPVGFVTTNTDCNNTSAAVYPGATEVCNSIDDDCDTQIDEGLTFTNYYADVDGDGFGAGAATSACAQPLGFVTTNTDCNNTSAAVYPGATEVCNSIDDDCDTQIDEGVQNTYYLDADGDSYGNAASSVQACTLPVGYVTNSSDCNDTNIAINPTTTWYLNADGDGYYVWTSVSCTSPGVNYNTTGGIAGDCNDTNAAVNAGATEICNGIDDDCDAKIDENSLNGY